MKLENFNMFKKTSDAKISLAPEAFIQLAALFI